MAFVASKSKVAPLNTVSIPRFELMGAMLGLSLALSVGQGIDVSISDMKFWSGRMNALYWIKKPSRSFKPFVANRVGELDDKTNPNQWRYVNTFQNPADIDTREASLDELERSELWWNGPTFLGLSEVEWREPKFPVVECEESLKMKGTKSNLFGLAMTRMTKDQTLRLNVERFSSWKRLIRV